MDMWRRAVGLDWKEFVRCDASMQRPAEVEVLCGDATKARERLGWRPEVGFESLIRTMVAADLEGTRSIRPALPARGTARVVT